MQSTCPPRRRPRGPAGTAAPSRSAGCSGGTAQPSAPPLPPPTYPPPTLSCLTPPPPTYSCLTFHVWLRRTRRTKKHGMAGGKAVSRPRNGSGAAGTTCGANVTAQRRAKAGIEQSHVMHHRDDATLSNLLHVISLVAFYLRTPPPHRSAVTLASSIECGASAGWIEAAGGGGAAMAHNCHPCGQSLICSCKLTISTLQL